MDSKLTGKLISEKRKEKGLNQIQLGELLNVSNRTVSKWEKGDGYPDITLLPDIADCLGITIDELLTGNAPAAPSAQKSESIKNNSDNRKKVSHEFKLLFLFALFMSIFSALLGGVTELYCIWAFPILFYTHWEIMFAAVSLFAVVVGILLFVVGIYRLHLEYSRAEIISQAKNKGLALFIISTVFPLCFTARILDIAFHMTINRVYIIMAVLIAVIALTAFVLYKRINNENEKVD